MHGRGWDGTTGLGIRDDDSENGVLRDIFSRDKVNESR